MSTTRGEPDVHDHYSPSIPARVLAVGAHPDDLEIGCGGTLAKLRERGAMVRAVVLSQGRDGLPVGSNVDRLGETQAALSELGIDDLVFADFPDRHFGDHLNAIIAFLEEQIAEFAPQRLYTMHGGDRHQDHRCVFEASQVAARCVAQVLLYETPSSSADFAPSYYEQIEAWLDAKLAALAAHESQAHRAYMHPDQARSQAVFRGRQVGCGPCEGYTVLKMVA